MRQQSTHLAALLLIPALTMGCAGATSPTSTISPAVAATVASRAPRATVPKNVIVLIGDGMGFGAMDMATLYRYGTSYGQAAVNATTGTIVRQRSVRSEVFQKFPVRLAMQTTQSGGSYSPEQAWSSFRYVLSKPTDSAAAATAMATGTKTYNSAIGVNRDHNSLRNLTESAIARGKRAGVVTSVPFSHATPAGFSAHERSRDSYQAIARDQLNSKLSVIIGAGHPWYDDAHRKRSVPQYDYISESDYLALANGQTSFSFRSSAADFDALTAGSTPSKVFGIARVASTLQQKRPGTSTRPGDVVRNDVPTLATLASGAINVLDNDPDGFFLMVEGGAIDWAGHRNQAARSIEETLDFNKAIATVVAWVEEKSSWDETLVIVTADHDNGYLTGPGSDPNWTPITGSKGKMPKYAWNTTGHSKSLVPFFAKGAGAQSLTARATRSDPVRGAYLDNTAIGDVVKGLWLKQ